MSFGTHAYVPDARNASVLFNLNGKLVSRDQAVVNVFDSGFMLGDGVWEGLRVHQGRIAFLTDHLDRLWEGAAALDIDIGLSQADLTARIYETLSANDMTRRGRADVQDPGLNSHSKINCVTACIQAIKAGADEGLMLDPQGFVATCNSTHFFIVRKGEVWTSTGDYCLGGITRGKIIDLCRASDIPVFERNFPLAKCYGADEAFTTGTFAGLVERLQSLYLDLIHRDTAA